MYLQIAKPPIALLFAVCLFYSSCKEDEEKQHPTGYVLENNTSNGNYFGIHIWNFGTNGWPDSSILVHIGNDFTGNQQKDVWIIP
ncbi:MAG: hypothetical protein L3J31_08310 [Bacteroidales bacterium]|nr:hypothetical protein [Bacteroidales bacterium]MCF6342791.1 hypothetical protein [Bacteroidales bacterium]